MGQVGTAVSTSNRSLTTTTQLPNCTISDLMLMEEAQLIPPSEASQSLAQSLATEPSSQKRTRSRSRSRSRSTLRVASSTTLESEHRTSSPASKETAPVDESEKYEHFVNRAGHLVEELILNEIRDKELSTTNVQVEDEHAGSLIASETDKIVIQLMVSSASTKPDLMAEFLEESKRHQQALETLIVKLRNES
jgi:hypothetical protein